jgi:SAM-dependent methyltransferase
LNTANRFNTSVRDIALSIEGTCSGIRKDSMRNTNRNHNGIYKTSGDVSWRRTVLLSILNIVSPLYRALFPGWTKHLKKELADCDTVLDLGCGYNSPIQYCNTILSSVGVELFEPYLRESSRKHIHSQYLKADVMKLEFKPKSFDAVVALELLEHLSKEEGYELISKMSKWAKKKVVLTTPNEYFPQDIYDNNILQLHRAGWSAQELRKLGFQVRGMNGWKALWGEKGSLKYRPPFIWGVISDLSQKMTYRFPGLAFQLFAIKRIKEA